MKAVIVTYSAPAQDAALDSLLRLIEVLLIENGFEPDELLLTVSDIEMH